MSPMNGSSVPRRHLMDRLTCASCGKTAKAEQVKREGWKPITQGSRIVGTTCGKCST